VVYQHPVQRNNIFRRRQSQYKTVVFDYEKASFNEGQPLPAGSYLLLQGPGDSGGEIVKVFIYPGFLGSVALPGQWKRTEFSQGNISRCPSRRSSNPTMNTTPDRVLQNDYRHRPGAVEGAVVRVPGRLH
jgi:hypothetical protein